MKNKYLTSEYVPYLSTHHQADQVPVLTRVPITGFNKNGWLVGQTVGEAETTGSIF